MDRFKTFWRLCKNSSDWCAKENECSDSVGKRDKSSVKLGDVGPPLNGKVLEAASMALMEVERDKATTDGLRDEEFELGKVGVLEGG
jgi:hypothetical protein